MTRTSSKRELSDHGPNSKPTTTQPTDAHARPVTQHLPRPYERSSGAWRTISDRETGCRLGYGGSNWTAAVSEAALGCRRRDSGRLASHRGSVLCRSCGTRDLVVAGIIEFVHVAITDSRPLRGQVAAPPRRPSSPQAGLCRTPTRPEVGHGTRAGHRVLWLGPVRDFAEDQQILKSAVGESVGGHLEMSPARRGAWYFNGTGYSQGFP